MSVYEKALMLYRGGFEPIKLGRWWNPFAKWLWLSMNNGELSVSLSNGERTHNQINGPYYAMTYNTNGTLDQVYKTVVTLWPVTNLSESKRIHDEIFYAICIAYAKHFPN